MLVWCAIMSVMEDLEVMGYIFPTLVNESESMESPPPSIFLAKCERAMVDPHEALHVGAN